MRRKRIPSYSLHAPSGQARVIIDGRHVYLGNFDSPESKVAYDRVVRELLTKREQDDLKARVLISTDLTVAELIASYLGHCRNYYVKHGVLTTEYPNICRALNPLLERHGADLVTSFGPLALKAIREGWVADGIVRTQINRRVDRIRAAFAWGVEQELLSATVLEALKAVRGLRRGRSPAREGKRVRPANEAHVTAIQPFVSRQIWAMICVQRATGARSGEVIAMRTGDINMANAVWEYRPREHKGEHHERDRVVYIGPKCQEILRRWLRTNLEEHLFQPREAMAEYAAILRERRRTAVQPSQQHRRKTHRKRPPGERYSRAAYARAIAKACRKARVPHWHPHQLRHLVATEVRASCGLEHAQVILGHARANTAEIYAEKNHQLGHETAERFG